MTKPIYERRSITDLRDMLNQSVELYSDYPAFNLKKNGEYSPVSYKQFKDHVDAFGTSLVEMGLQGEKVAVISENRYEWCMTFLTVTNGVGVIVPLDKELPANEIENLLIRSKAKAIVFSRKYRNTVEEIKKKLTTLDVLIDMDLDKDEGNIYSLNSLIAKGNELVSKGNKKYIDADINVEEMAGLFFTSGTTDLAKGVMLSHKNLTSDIYLSTSVLNVQHGERVLSILPIHHTYECTCGFLVMLYIGATISFCEGLKHISNNLKEVKPTVLLVVPLLLETMYKKVWTTIAKNKKTGKVKFALALTDFLKVFGINLKKKIFKDVLAAFGGEIKYAIAGGAAVDPDVLKGLKRFGITTIQGYGLTEASPIAALNQEKNNRDAAIGLPLPDVQLEIFEPDAKGVGEIRIKGPNIMMGYYEDPELTSKVLKDGWFYTGDIGYEDKDGFFYITGRKKNVIITKNGKNVFPEEVEAYLNKSPYILESMVIEKETKDEDDVKLHGIIVPNYDEIKKFLNKEELDKEEVHKLIAEEVRKTNRQMPIYKAVKEFEIREIELVKTTTKKIKRSANI